MPQWLGKRLPRLSVEGREVLEAAGVSGGGGGD
jgi:hypothetical protein